MNDIYIKQKSINRNTTIDIIKGVAIFLVLWGHFIQYTALDTFDYFENEVFKFIYSFHMPLFALISGYLFYGTLQRKSLKEMLISRVIGFLIPIAVWTTINWGLSIVLNKTIDLSKWWSTFTGSFLWFIWSILASSIVLGIIIKKVPNKYKIVAILIGFFTMYIFPNQEMNLFIYPFFVLGYLYKANEEPLKKYYKYGYIAIIAFIVMLIFFKRQDYIYITGVTIWNGKANIIEHILIDIYRYAIGLLGSVSVLMLIKMIEEKIPEHIKGFIEKCGRYSMQIYILQSIIFRVYIVTLEKIINFIGNNVFTQNIITYNYIITPILAIITIGLTILITEVLNKNKKVSKFLFGR